MDWVGVCGHPVCFSQATRSYNWFTWSKDGLKMSFIENCAGCQIPSLQLVAEGVVQGPDESFGRRLKLIVRRHLSPARERRIKNYTNDLLNRICKLTGRCTKPPASAKRAPAARLEAGDWVRVRSREEIESTLNHWRQSRGCAFMPGLAEYCGTIQRVHNCMKNFVDERDLKVKKSPGIILLEGVICKGTAEFGSCDRVCLHFWREEWFEKLEAEPVFPPTVSAQAQVAGHFVKVRPLHERRRLTEIDDTKGAPSCPKWLITAAQGSRF